MKKNLILFFTLIALLIFTYFFEELGSINRSIQFEKENRAVYFDFDDISEIILPNAYLIKKENQFFDTKYNRSVDIKELSELLNALVKIKINEEIFDVSSDIINSAFQNSVDFTIVSSDNRKEYSIGSLTSLVNNFYLKIKEDEKIRYFICEDVSSLEEAYDLELEKIIKYDSLLKKIKKTNYNFISKKIFKNSPEINKVKIDNFRNIIMTLFLETKTTIPEIYKGLSYDQLKMISFINNLKNLTFTKLFDKNFRPTEKVSTIELNDRDTVSLFKKNMNENGYFVKLSSDDNLYEISEKNAELFFVNVQDFWNLSPQIPPIVKDLNFLFEIDNKAYDLVVKKSENFDINFSKNDTNLKLNQNTFKTLFALILGINNEFKALRVSNSKIDKNPYKMISIKWDNYIFTMLQRNREIILIDEKNNVNFHYPSSILGFTFDWSNFFTRE